MKTVKILGRLSVISLLALTVFSNYAQAADNYLVLKRSTTTLNDGAATFVLSFLLPANTSTSSNTVKSAVLQFMADDVDFPHNEIYVNPPTTVCTDNGTEDANQSASIGLLSAHASSETFTEHRAFSSRLLQPGEACTIDNDCPTSNLCRSGACHNRLLFCSRTSAGLADQDVTTNDVDSFSLYSIVLHFKTN